MVAAAAVVPGSVKCDRAGMCVCVNKCDIARKREEIRAIPRDVAFSRNARRALNEHLPRISPTPAL